MITLHPRAGRTRQRSRQRDAGDAIEGVRGPGPRTLPFSHCEKVLGRAQMNLIARRGEIAAIGNAR